jgi:hypothetical protein
MSTAIAERDLLASTTSCCGRSAATMWLPRRPLAPTTRILMMASRDSIPTTTVGDLSA